MRIQLMKLLILFMTVFITDLNAKELKLNEVPPEIAKECLDEYGKIANSDQGWDNTCVSTKGGLPRSKFILACEESKDFFLVCNKGGYTSSSLLYIFKKDKLNWNLLKTYRESEIRESINCLNFKKYFLEK